MRRRSHLDLQADPLKNLGDLRQHDIGERIHENVLIRCPQTEQNLSRGEKGETRSGLSWWISGAAMGRLSTRTACLKVSGYTQGVVLEIDHIGKSMW
jgi:hypothetical protein